MKKKDIKPETFAKVDKATLHPMLATLPEFLKDPKNYRRVQMEILDAGASKHSHGEVVDWAGCAHCQSKQRDRLEMMRKLGFQSAAQYKAWQLTHEEIKKRMPLDKYNKMVK